MIAVRSKPYFIIIGVHKCGTTSLYDAICTHPDVSKSAVKEPHYFTAEYLAGSVSQVVQSTEEYYKLFASDSNMKSGEASVTYFHYIENIAAKIKSELGEDIRIIVVLRDPVQRAYSAYLDVSRHNELERCTFLEALELEDVRNGNPKLPPTMLYKRGGEYFERVRFLLNNFNNVHVVVFDELVSDSTVELERIMDFLDLDRSHPIYFPKSNLGGTQWKSGRLGIWIKTVFSSKVRLFLKRVFPSVYGNIVHFAKKYFMKKSDDMHQDARTILVEHYFDDVAKLSRLLRRNLKCWTDKW